MSEGFKNSSMREPIRNNQIELGDNCENSYDRSYFDDRGGAY